MTPNRAVSELESNRRIMQSVVIGETELLGSIMSIRTAGASNQVVFQLDNFAVALIAVVLPETPFSFPCSTGLFAHWWNLFSENENDKQEQLRKCLRWRTCFSA